MTDVVELGLDTFGDVTSDSAGQPLPSAQVIRNVIAEGILADSVNIDFIGVGEHHRADFAVSAPDVVLAGIAAQTKRIKLGSAVTVLSSDDPIRVFQRFATIDAISHGRAEVILGRGSFTESFPLFGYDLNQYNELFSEKLDLFAALLEGGAVSWDGNYRSALVNQHVYPEIEHGKLKTWIGVGGSPESVVRAAHYDLPLMLAVIGGDPARFKPFVDLHYRAYAQMKKDPQKIGMHSPGFIADTDAEAREQLWPHYRDMHGRIGRERSWPPLTRAQFDSEIAHGSLYVGAPETVAHKIAATVKTLGVSRFDLKYSAGTLPHELLMHAIELYGTKVIPMVRELVSKQATLA